MVNDVIKELQANLDKGIEALRPLYAAAPEQFREQAMAMAMEFDAASVVAMASAIGTARRFRCFIRGTSSGTFLIYGNCVVAVSFACSSVDTPISCNARSADRPNDVCNLTSIFRAVNAQEGSSPEHGWKLSSAASALQQAGLRQHAPRKGRTATSSSQGTAARDAIGVICASCASVCLHTMQA